MNEQIAIAVVQRESEFLAARRAEDLPLGGYWEFPGGKLENQESAAEAALRECREETGLDVEITQLLHVQPETYAHGSLTLHFFLCRLLDPHAEPRSPWQWIPRQQLHELEFPSGNRCVIEILSSG